MTADALTLRIDGSQPLSPAVEKALALVCDHGEAGIHAGNGNGAGTGNGAGGGHAGIVAVHVAGTPVGNWSRGLDVVLVTKWERALRRLERLPMVSVGIANGDCGGVALDAFLATDVRVATPCTRLVIPRDGTATWPGMATFRLVQQAGAARTRRAVLFGRPIDMAEAQALGIVDEVADDPAAELTAVAQLVGDLSGREVAVRRQLLLDATTTCFEDALGTHLGACDRALRRGPREETP